MMSDFDFKTRCDICHGGFTKSDIERPDAVARLRSFGGSTSTWVLVGFGSGYGEKFVHSSCLKEKGELLARPLGLSGDDPPEVDPWATGDDLDP